MKQSPVASRTASRSRTARAHKQLHRSPRRHIHSCKPHQTRSRRTAVSQSLRPSTTFRSSRAPRALPLGKDPSAMLTGADTTAGGVDDGLAGIAENPLFAAGLGLSMLGVGMQLFRKGMQQGLLQLERHMTTSLEVPSRDRSYQWVLNWCTAQTKGKSQHIGVETRVVHQGNGVHSTSFDFVPSPGRHFIWYKKNLIQIIREREKMADLSTGAPFETVKLTVFSRNRAIFNDILEEAEQAALQKEEGRMTIYMPMMTDWRPFGRPRPKRPLDSVILDEGIADFLSNDVRQFQKSGQWYREKGVPHRRGYLLYGPPGSGKTSFIQALAGDLGYSICVLSLNDRGLSDDRLLHLMTDIPPRSIILFEDIDAVFNSRETTFNVTFSGLLNALDGVTSVDERIVFMTTNHLEKLDPALIRPGRVDAKVFIGDSTSFQQRKMFLTFFPDVTQCPEVDTNAFYHNKAISSTVPELGPNGTMIGRSSHTDPSVQIGAGDITPATQRHTPVDDDNTAVQPEVLSEHALALAKIDTSNTEGFARGLFNRAKETVTPDKVKNKGSFNADGSAQRLTVSDVLDRVNPEFLAIIEQDGGLDPRYLSLQRPEDGPEGTASLFGSEELSPSQRLAQLQQLRDSMTASLEENENDLDDSKVKQRRQARLTAIINQERTKLGLAPVDSVDVPEELIPIEERQREVDNSETNTTEQHTNRTLPPPPSIPASEMTAGQRRRYIEQIKLHSANGDAPAVDYLELSRKQHNSASYAIQQTQQLADEFVQVLAGANISMAELQSLMLLYKDRPKMCIQGAKQLVLEKKQRLEKMTQFAQSTSSSSPNQ